MLDLIQSIVEHQGQSFASLETAEEDIAQQITYSRFKKYSDPFQTTLCRSKSSRLKYWDVISVLYK